MNRYGQIKNLIWYIGFRKPIKNYMAKQDVFWIGIDILTRDKNKPVFKLSLNWYVFDCKNYLQLFYGYI